MFVHPFSMHEDPNPKLMRIEERTRLLCMRVCVCVQCVYSGVAWCFSLTGVFACVCVRHTQIAIKQIKAISWNKIKFNSKSNRDSLDFKCTFQIHTATHTTKPYIYSTLKILTLETHSRNKSATLQRIHTQTHNHTNKTTTLLFL